MNISRFYKQAILFGAILICLLALNSVRVSASKEQGAIAELPNMLFEGCTPISLDTVVNGSISVIGETDCLTFDGAISDQILIRLLDTDDTSFYPEFNFFGPDETWLCYSSRFIFGEQVCTLDAAGTHSILINDYGNDQTGTYSVYVQRLNSPANASPVIFDQTVSGNISSGLDVNAHTFSATAGDSVLIRMLDTTGTNFYPSFDLYDATGTWVCSNLGDPLTENECPLTITGNYSILAGDYFNAQAGSYNLYIQQIKAPVDVTAIDFDQVVSGDTTSGLDMNGYSFSASAGDRVLIRMFDTGSTAFYPEVNLYRPDGTWLCSYDGDSFVERECSLDASGDYSILVGDHFGVQAGSYSLYIQRLNDPVNSTPIVFDQMTSGAIPTELDTNAHTFNATAGDRILIRALNTSGINFNIGLRIYRPDGTLLCSYFGDPFPDRDCSLDMTGAYSILMGDYLGVQAGSYNLYIQLLQNPVNASVIALDQVVSDSISTLLDTNAYTFTGIAGERVFVRVLDVSDTPFYPYFQVYRPDGTWLCGHFGDPLAEWDCSLDTTGTYSILVSDLYGTLTGDYQVYVQRLSNPINATSIAYDQVISGDISIAPDVNAYIFNGTANDRITIRLVDTSGGSFLPRFQVYRPDGTWLCASPIDNLILDRECTLDVTGTYSILVGDYYGDQTGSYSLYMQNLKDPANATPLALGQVTSGSISTILEMNAYSFTGAPGDQVLMRIFDPGGDSFYPRFWVYGPDGNLLCNSLMDTFDEQICVLDAAGIYSVLVGDYTGSQIGDYRLYVQRTRDPGNPIPLTYDETVNGTINLTPHIDTYTFNGFSGDGISVTVHRTSGNLNPVVQIFYPEGGTLCSQTAGSATTVELYCLIDVDGTYTILVGDHDVNIGGYEIKIESGWFIGRHSAPPIDIFGREGPIAIKVSEDFSRIEKISADPTCLPHVEHSFIYIPDLPLPIANGQFLVMDIPLEITDPVINDFSMDIDGVFFDTDNDGTPDHAVGGFVFRPGSDTTCVMQWSATGIGPDMDSDGWNDSAETMLGSSVTDVSSTPENSSVPTTLLASRSVCEDFKDNDGDGLVDSSDLGCPPVLGVALRLNLIEPERASSGETVTLVAEYSNVGIETAENVVLIIKPSLLGKFVSASSDGLYDSNAHTVHWNLGSIHTGESGTVTVKIEFLWGIPIGTRVNNIAQIESSNGSNRLLTTQKYLTPTFDMTSFTANDTSNNAREVLISAFCASLPTGASELCGLLSLGSSLPLTLAELSTERVSEIVRFCGSDIKFMNEAAFWHYYPNYSDPRESVTGLISRVIQGEVFDFQAELDRLNQKYSPRLSPQELSDTLYHDSPASCNSSNPLIFKGFINILNARDPNAKSVSPEFAQPGNTLNFTIEFENEGEGIAYGVYVVDTLDPDLDASTLTFPPQLPPLVDSYTYNSANRTIVWYIGEVGPGVGGQLPYSINVRSDAPPDYLVTNYATVYFPSVPEITNTNGVAVQACYSLNIGVNDSEYGSVIPDPAPNCPDGVRYLGGTNVTLTANPEFGYEFTQWANGATGTANPLTVEMLQDRTITANFQPTISPVIGFTYIPPYGTPDDLNGVADRVWGQVKNVVYFDYYVAIYIKVNAGWWIKPYYGTPKTLIDSNGDWMADIVTGGIDEQATEIVAYLFPNSFDIDPYRCLGCPSLPQELDQNAAAKAVASRVNVPTVFSVTQLNPNPTDAASVTFTVTFSESVTGVDTAPPYKDFALTTTSVTGAAITNVSGSDATYTVTVNTGSGNGTIRLDVVDDDSIVDTAGNPLGGVGVGNGDFTEGQTYTIIKTVTISGNAGVVSATLDYTDGSPKTVTTDGSGNYSITVPYNWSGTVTPSQAGYTFSPVNRTYSNVLSDQTAQDYTATAITYSISGNAGVGGATLSYTDGLLKTATADGSGNYSFTVPYSWSGTVTPSKSGYSFSPVNRTYSNVLSNQTAQDYTATAIIYSISGNAGVAGATLSYLDDSPKTATADGAGNYSFTVTLGWSGTVTPSLAGCVFTPPSISYNNVTTNQVNQNYVAKKLDTFHSIGAYDGWILESSENNDKGSTLNSSAATLFVGDDAKDRQYKSILSFDTSNLPDNAVITSVTLRVKKYSLVGTDPFDTHNSLLVDISKPYFGNSANLLKTDFQAAASANQVGTVDPTAEYDWYSVSINEAAFPFFNLTGTTQLRMRFFVDDNDDKGADYVIFYSGDANLVSDRPALQILYYVP